jgi:Domain of unknown function (DUF6531)
MWGFLRMRPAIPETSSTSRLTLRSFVALCAVLAGTIPGSAQTFNYTFSSCASGVTLQATLPVTAVLMAPAVNSTGSVSTTYRFNSATLSLTVGGSTMVYTGHAQAVLAYFPTPAALAFTSLVIAASGPDFSFSPNVPNWSVHLTGAGNLLPNGMTQALPPLSAWSNNDADNIDTPQEFQIDTFGSCGGSGAGTSASDAGQALGNPKDNPGCPICGDVPSGDPISVGTGNMFEQVDDYHTSGANPLGFTRYYNSMGASNTFANTLGTNWSSSYDRYLRIVSASSVVAERADGQQVTFTSTNGSWTAATDVDVKLTNSGATWTLTDRHDTIETYTVAAGTFEGLLQSIRARNGYTQTLQYGSGNQLATVSDSFQRQLSFTYSGALPAADGGGVAGAKGSDQKSNEYPQ